MKKYFLLAMCAMLFACSSEKPFPNKEITLIVSYQPGGGTDSVARAIADSTKDILKVPINVVNKPGGGGALGMLEGANAKPDGYTITTIVVELTTLRHLNNTPLSKDMFRPLIMLNSAPATITVHKDSPYNTIEGFLAASKTKNMKIGNSGIGAIWHLAAVDLEQKAGVKFNHIPFDGAGPAVKELLGKQIDAVSVSVPEVRNQVEANQFKILAVMSDERHPAFPDVPTLKEKGYDVVVGTWRGLGVPKATPDAVFTKLEDAFSKGIESPKFIEFMEKGALDITYLNSTDFALKIDEEDELFKQMIIDAGLKK